MVPKFPKAVQELQRQHPDFCIALVQVADVGQSQGSLRVRSVDESAGSVANATKVQRERERE